MNWSILEKYVPLLMVIIIFLGINNAKNNENSHYNEGLNYEYQYQEEDDDMITEEELFSIELYFINNGYYYHDDKNCEGLEGYSNLNVTYYDELLDYPNLEACNWCVLRN